MDPPVPVSDELPAVLGSEEAVKVLAIPLATAFTNVWVLAPVDVNVISVGVDAIASASEAANCIVSSSTRIT